MYGGLNKMDLKTKRFTRYKSKEGDKNSLPSNIIRDIVPYKDQLLIGFTLLVTALYHGVICHSR